MRNCPQSKGYLFPSLLSRGLVHKEACSHLKVLLAGSPGVLCTAGPCPQLVEAICFVNWQVSFIIWDRDWILGPLAGESCWNFSGWLSKNLANQNVFLSCRFKGTVLFYRKISARFFFEMVKSYNSVQKHVALNSCPVSFMGAFPVLFLTSPGTL